MPKTFDRNSRKEDGITFDEWKKLVDVEFTSHMGMGCDDVPDVDFWSAWDAGQTAKEAGREFSEQITSDLGFNLDDF